MRVRKEEDGWEMRVDYDMGNCREWCEVESAIVIPPHGLRQASGPSRVYEEKLCLRHKGRNTLFRD